MIRKYLAVSALTGLAACGGGEFLFPLPGDPPVTPVPSTDVTLDVNKLDFDAANNQVVVNNLPFAGPDNIYDQISARTEVDGFGVYTSRQSDETGRRQYYAVFRRSGNGQVAAIATPDYQGFGFGGTAVERTNANTVMPTTGEFVYRGLYGGVRTFSDRGGIELVEGDVLLEVDLDDFDNIGAVEGRVTNRTAYNINGVPLQPLPTIIFATTSINFETGALNEGAASTQNADRSSRDTGTYRGLFVGPNGEEIIGSVNMTGSFTSYRIIEAVPGVDGDGNATVTNRQIGYAELLALRAAGDATRLDRITISENAESFQVRELGVFTAAD